MSSNSYRIEDEPMPGALSAWAVKPLWPFIAVMFGGALISWLWFLFNSFAVGSPTQKRECTWIAAGFAGSLVLVFTILSLHEQGVIAEDFLKYALLLVTVWKLAVTYVLFTLQSHTIELFEYYGGQLKNGIFILIAGVLASPFILASFPTAIKVALN